MLKINIPFSGLAPLLLTLASCGGSGGDGGSLIGGVASPNAAPITVVGRIDGFGSVFVDGIEFETNRTSFRIDDRDGGSDRDLSVGMIVRVEGSTDRDGHGQADRIEYDDDLEGIVAGLVIDPDDASIKRFTIFSTPIVASAVTTVFKSEDTGDYNFDALANGDHIEVNGEFDGEVLVASFIKLEDDDDDDFELKGVVSAFDGTSFTLTLRNGATFAVTLAPSVTIPASGIMDGQLVEVEATIPDPIGAPTELLASRVELEDRHDFDDHDGQMHGDELRIEGLLSLDGEVWHVRDTPLEFTATSEYRPASLAAALDDGSAAGLRVKIRGSASDDSDGVLRVERIETEARDDLEISGIFESSEPAADTGVSSVVIAFPPADGSVSVLVTPETLLKNDDGGDPFELGELQPGLSAVEVHGHLDQNGAFVASVFEREDRSRRYEIEGPLDPDGFVAGVSISVLGVRFGVNVRTDFDDGTPRNGDRVKLRDNDRDGVADEIDIED